MGSVSQPLDGSKPTRVFLSYSRIDREFAERLRDRLVDQGFDAYLDVHDIAKGEPWQERLQNLIFGADAALFLVSPDSIASPVCDWEVNEVERLAKRLLPVVCRATPDEVVPGRLKRLNYTFLDDDEKWSSEFPRLCEALNRDLLWMREHTRLSDLAARWERDGRPQAQLLRLDVVLEARRWEGRRPAGSSIGELLSAFLDASQDKEAHDRDRLLTITGRAFVKPAEQAVTEGRFDAALRLAAAGVLLGEDLDMRLVPERVRSTCIAAEAQPLRSVLLGHEQALNSALFSPDGTRILTASHDCTARLWNAHSGREISVMRGHESSIDAIAFSPDGTRIVSASSDQTARIWDATTGANVAVLRGHDDDVCDARFSPDGARVVTASGDKTARVWDASTGREIVVLRGHGEQVVRVEPENWAVVADSVLTAAFDPTGTRILTASLDGTARVWDAASGRELFAMRGHTDVVEGASYSSDGACVVTICQDRTARLWDAKSGRELAVLSGHEHGVTCAAFGPDGRFVVTTSESARLWEVATGREVAFLSSDGLSNAVFSPDGTRIATHGERQVQVWDVAAAREIFTLRGHGDIIRSVAFSPDGGVLLTSSADCTARLWDSSSGREIVVLRGNSSGWSMHSAKFSPDGTRLVTACTDKTARVWDAETGREIASLPRVRSVTFGPDGSQILTACEDDTARLWAAETGRAARNLECDKSVWDLAIFSPRGEVIATTVLVDSSVRVWDARSGNAVAAMLGHEAAVMDVSFSPDGSRVVTASRDGTARIWEASTGREIAILRGHAGAVTSAVFGPEGKSIVTGSGDASVRIWDATGRETAALLGHEYWVDSVCFSPDGARVVSASSIDKTTRIWDVASRTEVMILRHDSGVNSATFDPNGVRVLTAATDGAARIWDVNRTVAIAGSPIEALAASLSNGRGVRIASERDDLIMQAAPDDLYSAIMERLSPTQRDSVAIRSAILARPLHPNCYLAPSARSVRPMQSAAENAVPMVQAVAASTPPWGMTMLFLLLLGATAGAIALWLRW